MEDSINAILDEYGIVKGEANYEFKDRFVVGASKHITPFKAEGLWHDFEAQIDFE